MSQKADGVLPSDVNYSDVVIISRGSATELGRLLSFEAILPFRVLGFKKDDNDSEWESVSEVLTRLYPDYLNGVKPRRNKGTTHSRWLGVSDEDRIVHIIRSRFQTHPILTEMFCRERRNFVLISDVDEYADRFDWLAKEYEMLKRYYRKCYVIGHQQPFVRSGRSRPYIWR